MTTLGTARRKFALAAIAHDGGIAPQADRVDLHSGRGASHLTILSKTAALLDVPVEVAVDLVDHGWTVDGVTFTLGSRLNATRRA
jgi:hypothetical protein